MTDARLLPIAVVAIVIGGLAVTSAQQAPEQVRVPGMGRTIPGDRGIVEGQVVEAGTGRPIAGARVDVRGPSDQVYVNTDQSGRYETRPLTPGAYTVSVTAPDYATAFYDGRAASMSGQSSIDGSVTISGQGTGAPRITLTGNVEIRSSTTVDIGPGSLLSNIDVVMQATGRLSGRILDDRGRGLAGAYIQLIAAQASGVLIPRIAYARSETDGTYRVTAAPGDYIVRAYADKQVRPSRDAALAYAETFFPGVREQDDAQAIRLDSGVEQYDVDFALLSSRAVRVSGTVIDPSGTDLEDVTVRLGPQGPFGSSKTSVQLQLNARGEFEARDVVPGVYHIEVTDPHQPERWKTPRQPVEIAEDVTGLEIRAVAPASIAGRVVKDPRSAGRINLTQTVISFVNRGEGASTSMSAFNLEEDGSFHGDVATGALTLMLMGPQGWTTRAVRLDGVDVFGDPLEITPGAHEIEIVVTDHLGSASGLVMDRRGTPLGGFDVVLFPQDETRWHFASPLIRQTRSSQNGRFELPLLPPGDYLAVATKGVPFLMIGDPAPTLRRLQSIGTRLKVGDGEQKTISIRASPTPEGLVRFTP